MAADTSRSGASADSYIGNLISLTSKSEIRYEGLLYTINTDESSIGLRNVRSFGTEGRKKDGPQIPPSDKIYEYILFRGSDIKDLQVMSSPPAQPTTINNDPAIIQSHYPLPASTSTSVPSVTSGNVADLSSHTAQMGLPRTTFHGSLPLYPPGGGLGTWHSTPAPTANGSGLGMPPMYWQGYFAPSSGLPHLQQPSLLRPPPGLPIPQSMQHPFQYHGINPPVQSGPQNLPELLPLYPQVSSSLTLTSNTLPLPPDPSSANSLSLETSSTLMQNKTSVATIPASTINDNLPMVPPLVSNLEMTMPTPHSAPVCTNPSTIPGSTTPYISVSQPVQSAVLSSISSQVDKPITLVTPDQLLHSGSMLPSSLSLQTSHTGVDSRILEDKMKKPLLPEPSPGAPAETTEPILPLPKTTPQKPNGATSHNNYNWSRGRGRGRGRGNEHSRPMTKFTEDFDFMAMNEKFNKDEVWGHLGRNKVHVKDMDRELQEDETDDALEEEEALNLGTRPVYVKDDFFDSLSSTTLDRGAQGGRTRFSEQLKTDTETFGDFTRFRTSRGGAHGFRGGGRGRGSYYGRGYGQSNRGRGYGYAHRSS